jgi:uncharacterized membrane protein YhdT
MAIPLADPGLTPRSPPDNPKRRSTFGRLFGGARWLGGAIPDWLGARRIGRSWFFISDLLAVLLGGPRHDDRFEIRAGGVFDVKEAALAHGLSVAEMQTRLDTRRRQTARIAYTAFVLALAFLVGWLWQALSSPWSSMRITATVHVLPFSVLSILIALYHALLNFQIRIGRMASWREYLATNESFWPS